MGLLQPHVRHGGGTRGGLKGASTYTNGLDLGLMSSSRHARTCSGHPLPPLPLHGRMDARNKSGHDGRGRSGGGRRICHGFRSTTADITPLRRPGRSEAESRGPSPGRPARFKRSRLGPGSRSGATICILRTVCRRPALCWIHAARGRSPCICVRCSLRRVEASKGSRRCMVQRLSHSTTSPTCQRWR